MDTGCWISVFVSYFFIALALVIAVKVGSSYGVKRVDVVNIILTPFAMMNAEEMPFWFDTSNRSVRVVLRRCLLNTSDAAAE